MLRTRATTLPMRLEVLEARSLLSAGGLDPTFGVGGRTTIGFQGPTSSGALSVVVEQADGRIVVAGTTSGAAGADFAVARHDPDGTLDPTFGVGGRVVTDVEPGGFEQVAGVAVQADGRIVVAGTASGPAGGGFALARYDVDGSLDPSFGAGGIVTGAFASLQVFQGAGVAVQADGRIVVAGSAFRPFDPVTGSSDTDFAVARFAPDGTLDPSFGVGGVVTTDLGSGSFDQAAGLALQADGRVLVAGTASGPFDPGIRAFSVEFAVVRYDADGRPDPGFGTAGVVTTAVRPGGTAQAAGVAVRPDGRIVVAGPASGPFDPDTGAFPVDLVVVRYDADGRPDPGFGTAGVVTTAVRPDGIPQVGGVAVQADGRIVVAGTSFGGTIPGPFPFPSRIVVARYDDDGGLDPSFGAGGIVTTEVSPGGSNQAAGVAVQADGRVVVVGSTSGPSDSPASPFPPVPPPGDFALLRLAPDGSPDGTFGRDGRVRTTFLAAVDASGRGVAIQPDGKIVVVGAVNADFAVTRVNVDGSLDPSFGIGGRVVTGIAPSSIDTAHAVAIQPDGKIVVVGSTASSPFFYPPFSITDFAVVRYNADGVLDPTFGVGGIAVVDFASRDDEALGLAIQADGRIVVVGSSRGLSGPSFGSDFALARLGSDGAPDPTFGLGGLVLTDFAFNSEDVARAVAIGRDGWIVVAGSAAVPGGFGGSDIAVARYRPDGLPDRRFGREGRVTTTFAFGTEDQGFGVLLQPNGGIVVVGGTAAVPGASRFAIVGYRPDGRLNRRFGSGGLATTGFEGSGAVALAVVPRMHGRFVAVGTISDPLSGAPSFALAGYRPDGRPDRSFGANGRVVTGFGPGVAEASGAAVGRDGRVVVAGSARLNNVLDFALARYEGLPLRRPRAATAAGRTAP